MSTIDGLRLPVPSRVPTRAVQTVVMHRDAHGLSARFTFATGAIDAVWSLPERTIFAEKAYDAKGRPHGLEMSYDMDGTLAWQVPWVRGQQHGLARQFDADGSALSRSRFVRGTGVDVWVGDRRTGKGVMHDVRVDELREMRDNERHGLERLGDPLLPNEEGHYRHGREHGIFRRWTDGKLDPGYPKFFADGQQISKQKYQRLQTTTRSLPRYNPQQDHPQRPAPRSLQHIWLRADIKRSLVADTKRSLPAAPRTRRHH